MQQRCCNVAGLLLRSSGRRRASFASSGAECLKLPAVWEQMGRRSGDDKVYCMLLRRWPFFPMGRAERVRDGETVTGGTSLSGPGVFVDVDYSQ